MGLIYTQGSDVSTLEPSELSTRLESVVTAAMVWLGALSDERASVPKSAGKWSAKQVIGHLTDSAVNNLGRIVRMQITPGLKLAGYEQNEWVELQHYSELTNKAEVEGDELTLGFLIEDYISHMEHHLRALQGWVLTD